MITQQNYCQGKVQQKLSQWIFEAGNNEDGTEELEAVADEWSSKSTLTEVCLDLHRQDQFSIDSGFTEAPEVNLIAIQLEFIFISLHRGDWILADQFVCSCQCLHGPGILPPEYDGFIEQPSNKHQHDNQVDEWAEDAETCDRIDDIVVQHLKEGIEHCRQEEYVG